MKKLNEELSEELTMAIEMFQGSITEVFLIS